jgi:hypothetical protein
MPAEFFETIAQQHDVTVPEGALFTEILKVYTIRNQSRDGGSLHRRSPPREVGSIDVEHIKENITADEDDTDYIQDAIKCRRRSAGEMW